MSALPLKADIVHGGGISALCQKRTLLGGTWMSAKCQKATLARTMIGSSGIIFAVGFDRYLRPLSNATR